MRDLIAERPNMIPVGLGNSTSEIDPSVLADAPDDAAGSGAAEGGSGVVRNEKEEDGSDDVEVIEGPASVPTAVPTAVASRKRPLDDSYSSDSDADEDATMLAKAKAASNAPPSTPAPKTKTRATATPAPPATPAITVKDEKPKKDKPAGKKTKIGEFAEIAQAEEATQRDRVRLAKLKVEDQREAREAKVALVKQKMELKAMKYRIKAELQAKKMDQTQELEAKKLEIARLNAINGGGGGGGMGSSSGSGLMPAYWGDSEYGWPGVFYPLSHPLNIHLSLSLDSTNDEFMHVSLGEMMGMGGEANANGVGDSEGNAYGV